MQVYLSSVMASRENTEAGTWIKVATLDLNFLRENLDTSTHTNASVRFKIENLNTGINTNKGGFFDSSTP